MAETNRERQKRLRAACQPPEPIEPPRPDPTGEPQTLAIAWILERADFLQQPRITAYVKRQDWAGLRSYLKTTAAPHVFDEWQARAYPPPPKIFHGGQHPELSTADYVRARPLWKTIPVTLAELEQAAAKERAAAEELIFPEEPTFDPIN